MQKHVVFVQGVGEETYAHEDNLLVDNLQAELSDDYQIHYPPMPNPGKVQYTEWSDRIRQELEGLDGSIFLVGHSLGGSVVIKHLAEQSLEKPLAGVFLIAAPFWGLGEWQMSQFELAEDFAAHLPQGLPIFLYQGSDDEIVSSDHLARYQENLPQATARLIAGFDHQFNNDLSAVARDIKSL